MEKKKVYIFGTGKSALVVERCLKPEKTEIAGYLDNNRSRAGGLFHGKPVFLPEAMPEEDYDCIVIASVWHEEMKLQLQRLGIVESKILCFFDPDTADDGEYVELFDAISRKLEVFRQTFEASVVERFAGYCRNLPYEIADGLEKGEYSRPEVRPAEEAVERIIGEKLSVCRFGDGELEIMAGRQRARFQRTEEELGRRLKEVLQNSDPGILTCIANNYGSLSEYDEDAAMGIRRYMKPEVRAFHMSVLDPEKVYYDAYLSRPYIIYRDKEPAGRRFARLKQIWAGRKVVIIEGSGTRMGYGNDLLSDAETVERILCPDKNAWSIYDEICRTASGLEKDRLILIALGPAATVLAYDLAKAGYQAIDIGHLDNEYEWYLKGAKKRFNIPHKYVNELTGGDEVEEIHSEWYSSQVITDLSRHIEEQY